MSRVPDHAFQYTQVPRLHWHTFKPTHQIRHLGIGRREFHRLKLLLQLPQQPTPRFRFRPSRRLIVDLDLFHAPWEKNPADIYTKPNMPQERMDCLLECMG